VRQTTTQPAHLGPRKLLEALRVNRLGNRTIRCYRHGGGKNGAPADWRLQVATASEAPMPSTREVLPELVSEP
jgi:hypothetical protein